MLVYDDREDEEIENLHDYDYGYDYGLEDEDSTEEDNQYQIDNAYYFSLFTKIRMFDVKFFLT